VDTEIAFFNHPCDGIGIPYIIRTGSSTIVTTNTTVRIDQNNSILPLIGSLHRADGIADWAFTMITEPW
jgi:hypothetical protein